MSLETLSPLAQEVVDRWWTALEPEAQSALEQAIMDEGPSVVARLVGPPSLVFEMCGVALPAELDERGEPFAWDEVWTTSTPELPARIAELPARERALASSWWGSLDAGERARVEQAWSGGSPETHSLIGEANALFEIDGQYVVGDAEVERREREMWERELLEYASGGSSRMQWMTERTFHICRAHAKAKAALRSGEIPADFRCPLADRACPMRAALDARPGASIRLSVRPRL